jgi:hypothetical protein
MASNNPPIYQRATNFVLDVANGRHALSKLVPPALLAFDAVLCALVIWKIPCRLSSYQLTCPHNELILELQTQR